MDICTSVLKKICRKQGIKRWPHRKFKSLDRLINSLEDKDQVEQLKQKRELLLSDPNIEYTAIIPKSKLNSCNSYISKIKGPTKTIKKDKPKKLSKHASPPSLSSMEPLAPVKSVQFFTDLPFLVKKEERAEKTEKKVVEEMKTEAVPIKEETALPQEEKKLEAPLSDVMLEDDATEEDENLPMEILTSFETKLDVSCDEEIGKRYEKEQMLPPNSLLQVNNNNETLKMQTTTEPEVTNAVRYKEQLRLSTNSLAQFNAILADCKSFISYGRVLS